MTRLRAATLCLLVLCGACAARAERPLNPYTADQVERLLRGAVPPGKIVADARRECIAFMMSMEHESAFRRAGAPAWFADSIGTACRTREAGR